MVIGIAAAILPTSVIGGIIGAAGPLAGVTGLQARGGPLSTFERAPRIKPGDILRIALAAQALSESGQTPRIATDPFTGNLALSTVGQSAGLFNLLGERFAREALASTPAESAEIFREREQFIATVDSPVTAARQQVVLALSRESPKQVAPGVVSSALPSGMSRRLGGPCAGVTTGFARLNCARGGIS